ncbi:MAG: hypothetical protein KF860_16375 [Cyclobacteriaceae bacterium]|nr:hypothetical protein [Cyclobacteriaceae bacterium]
MKRNLLVILLFITTLGYGQLSDFDFADGDLMVKFSLRYAATKTLDVPADSAKDASGIRFRALGLSKANFDKGGYQMSHRFSFITESLFAFVIDAIDGGDYKTGFKNSSTTISDFILGWHNHTVNVISTDPFNLAVGAHWGDYFLIYEPYGGSGSSYGPAREPAGWYGALGPAVMLDFNLVNALDLHVEGAYAFTAKFMDAKDMEFDRKYPKPHFINLVLELRGNLPIYGGFEHVQSINRGNHPFNASRSDIFIGFYL